MACPRRRFSLFLWQWRSGRGSRKCSHYGDSVKRALSLVILVEILLVDLHDMRMQLLLTMFPLLILLPLLSIKLYLYVRMSTLSSFSIKQQSSNLFLLHHSPYLSRAFCWDTVIVPAKPVYSFVCSFLSLIRVTFIPAVCGQSSRFILCNKR